MSLRPEVSDALRRQAEREAATRGTRAWKIISNKRTKRPTRWFCYSTQPIVIDDQRGWASYIEECPAGDDVISTVTDSFVLHRRRKDARARAHALWQGARLGLGIDPKWSSWGGVQ